MAFTTPDFNEILRAILRDIKNQRPDANVADDGDYTIRASATAAAIEGIYQHQQWIVRQIFPDTADADYMEHHASLRNLRRKSANTATGKIEVTGMPGAMVPVGTEAKTADGVAILTTEAGEIGSDGICSICAKVTVPGTSGNLLEATRLTLTAAPSGVNSNGSVVSMTGGTEIESDASLLARLLFRLRNPPCGGADHDYFAWAMEVPGVSAAYVYPLRRGLGTVDVVVLTEGGIPGPDLVTAVQTHIFSKRPVTADIMALAPAPVPIDINGRLRLVSGADHETIIAMINAAHADYLAGMKPGDTAFIKRLESLALGASGVIDLVLDTPAQNVITHGIELPVMGVSTWGVL